LFELHSNCFVRLSKAYIIQQKTTVFASDIDINVI
jgi:hypothetical protein